MSQGTAQQIKTLTPVATELAMLLTLVSMLAAVSKA